MRRKSAEPALYIDAPRGRTRSATFSETPSLLVSSSESAKHRELDARVARRLARLKLL